MTESKTDERELEFKFVPSREVQARLAARNAPAEVVDVLKAAFDLGDYSFGDCKTQKIVDTYYDTGDLTLYRAHATLRVRSEDGKLEITLKTPRSHSPGVFDRHEFSLPVTDAEVRQHEQDGFRDFINLRSEQFVGFQLQPTLVIENERRKYRLARGDEKLDLCLDAFHPQKPGCPSNRPKSFEIEIEARSNAAFDRLSRIRSNVRSILPSLTTEDRSKYEQSVETLQLHRGRPKQYMYDLYHAPNFVGWAGVIISLIGVLITLAIFWIQSNSE